VLRLTEGGCDLLIAYHHASQPLQLSPDRYEMLSLGRETLAPYAKAGADGRPLFQLPSSNGRAVPYLSYGSAAYLSRMVEWIAKTAPEPLLLDAVYETDMSEGIKAMALEGHGLAFLPASTVRKELSSQRLVRASLPGQYELTMEVRIYRERAEPGRHRKPAAQSLWSFLAQDALDATERA
jgi:DNA-binding transcriptional LysR family regulator